MIALRRGKKGAILPTLRPRFIGCPEGDMNRLLSVPLFLVIAHIAHALDNAGPPPKAEPFSETTFGVRIDDPYRWMETPARAPEWSNWVKESSARTVAQLGALRGRQALVERMRVADAAGVRYSDPRGAGDVVIARRMDPGAQQAKIIVRTANGTERVLLDPSLLGEHVSINSYSVSPDGATLAVHTSAGGSEVGSIRFYDVATGAAKPGEITPVWGEFTVAWLSPTQVIATVLDKASLDVDPFLNMRAVLYTIGDSAPGAALMGAGVRGAPAMDPSVFPIIDSGEASRWVLGFGANARADVLVYLAESSALSAGRPAWRQIAGYEDAIGNAAVHGDSLFLLSTKDAPNGKIHTLPLGGDATLSSAKIALPESGIVISGLVAAHDGVYVSGQRDGLSHLLFIKGGRGAAREVPLPLRGTLETLRPTADGRGVTFTMADWFTPRRVFAAQRGRVRTLGLDSVGYAGVSALVERRDEAVSADGTRVPMAIILRRDIGARPDAPTLLTGYSGYGINTVEPRYSSIGFAFAESGGVLAYCGARGGGERGRAWHEGGRAANKPNAHADVIACGERLVALGLTSPGRMTLEGASMGGALVGPTGLKRPDLFHSAVIEVGILNPLRLGNAPNGANQYGEMGDPTTEAGFKGILLQDSYQMLGSAKDMPDTLLTIGLNDRRVTPWMSAKYAARALDRFGATRRVLIRADGEQGHGIGSDRELLIQEQADIFSFVFNRAGAPEFTDPPR